MLRVKTKNYRQLNSGKLMLLLLLFSLVVKGQSLPVDKLATVQTRNLYKALQKTASRGVMFGHQDDLASGVDWKELEGRSDTKELTGSYPAVFGWDIGLLEIGKERNFDYVSLKKIKEYIIQVHEQGGVNTISWHCNNPVDPKLNVRTNGDTMHTVHMLFADSALTSNYRQWLDRVADFMLSLRTPDGKLIPVIFRPFHENTGSWFWWGKDQCTPEEYIYLWRFTADYLKNARKVHNLLYAYSTDRFKSRLEYLERYPGDKYVDILGFDCYASASDTLGQQFRTQVGTMITVLKKLRVEKKKVIAFTETGAKLTPQGQWWTQTLLPVLQGSGLSYVLLWRNGSRSSYWSTFPGQPASEDFLKLHRNSKILFGNDISKKKIYGH